MSKHEKDEMERIKNELGCPECKFKGSFICEYRIRNGYTVFHLDKCITFQKEEA